MATAEDVATRALKRLGLVAAGDSPAAADVADGVTALNAMIAAWEADWLSGDVLPLADRFEQATVALLAVRLAEDFGAAVGPVLARDAENGWRQIQSAFFAVPQSQFENALTNTGTNWTFDQIAGDASNYAAWQASTEYLARQYVTNNQNLYECSTAGTSAASGGPTGATSDITDGTCVWVWRRVMGD